MKKIINMSFVLVLIFILTACNTDNENDPLRVGMDLRYPPFETVDTSNNPEGISVDIGLAFGEYLGREVTIVNTNFSSLIPALEADTIDIIIASMSITEKREESVDFTDPYFYFKIISLVNKDFADENQLTSDSSIDDILAIENAKFVGLATQVSATIPESYNKDVIEATDLGTAVESVAQGSSDILLMSANPVIDGYNANMDDTMIIWDSFDSSPIGMAVKEGNSELLAKANAFIDTFNDDGGLYDELSEKWNETLLAQSDELGLDFYTNE